MIIIGRPALRRLRYAPTSTGDHHFGALGCIVAQTSGSVNGQHEFEELALKVDCDYFCVEPQGLGVLPLRARFGAERTGETCGVEPDAGLPMLPHGPSELCDSGKKEAENGDSQGPELQLEPVIQDESNVPLDLKRHPIMARMIPYPEVGVEMQVDALNLI